MPPSPSPWACWPRSRATPAGATGYVCAVLPTSDGFVALRDGPSAKHAMIARMRAHELLDTMDEKTQDRVISGNWIG